MTSTPPNTPPARDWRWPLTIGLAVGIAIPLARCMEANLELGPWGTGAVSAAAAGLIGGVVALAVYGLLKLVGRGRAEPAVRRANALKDLPG